MKIKNALVVGALTLAFPFASVPGAMATPTTASSAITGHVTIDPDDPTVARVDARYVCHGGEGAALWVSAKQAPEGRIDQRLKEEGSSQHAAAWSHSHRNPVTCDGQWHTATFEMDQAEWGWGELQPGHAWVQFCLYEADGDSTTTNRFAAVR